MTILQDLRFALRLFARNPWFTAAALLPLALGIGANAAVLGLVDSLLLRPMTGITAEGLVWVSSLERGRRHVGGVSYPDLADLAQGAGVFDEVMLFRPVSLNVRLARRRDPERVSALLVTANYFATLGVRPALGRTFAGQEGTPGAAKEPEAVIAYDTWQGEFAGDPGVLGRSVEINGQDVRVVGVAPAGFSGCVMSDEPPKLWIPTALHGALFPAERDVLAVREAQLFDAVGRLKPGLSAASAAPAVDRLAARLKSAYPEAWQDRTLKLDDVRGSSHPTDRLDVIPLAGVAFAIAGVVLLIACANVGGLLLGRAAARGREIGIRLALGADRGRLARQLLTESVLLAVVAGGLGLVLATWTTGLLVAAVGVPFTLDVRPNLPTLAGTLGISMAAALVFGLAPALYAGGSRRGPSGLLPLLGGGAVTAGNRQRARLRRSFAAGQVALSLALLATAGLLVRSVQAASREAARDPNLERILAASVDLPAQGYSTARQLAFSQELLERLQEVPGVQVASLGTSVPGGNTMYSLVFAEGRPAHPGERPFTRVAWVFPRYFQALGQHVVRGRDFQQGDQRGAPLVAVVNETFARKCWPGEEPIGKRLRLGAPGGSGYEVVGVVRDQGDGPREPAVPAVFFARPQQAEMVVPALVVIRTAGPASRLAPELRRIVREMDPALPLFGVATVRQLLDQHLLPKRAASAALNMFGGLALCLASIGVYGLIAWMAGSRQREIGVRVALGATRAQVVGLIMAEGGRIALWGGATGLVLAVAATRLVSGMVTGAVLGDAAMFAGAGAIVLGAVAVASYLPARRATRVDPAVILRAE